MTHTDALISIRPRYVDQIISGTKTVEIRRRRVSLLPDSRLWIYSTTPVGKVRVLARIRSVNTGAPIAVWRKWGKFTGLEPEDYFNYLYGATQATAISLEVLQVLQPAPGLSFLRSRLGSFHPPQFFMKVNQDSDLLRMLMARVPSV